MHYLRRYRWRLFLVFVILVAGFGIAWLLISRNSGQSTLMQNQQRWANAQPSHYRYTFEPSCFCPPETTRPVIIEVNNGTTVAIRYVDDGTPAKSDVFDRYATIDKLFAIVQGAIQQSGSRLNVTYHPQLGYPTTAAIDYFPNAVDDEFYFTVRDLEAVK